MGGAQSAYEIRSRCYNDRMANVAINFNSHAPGLCGWIIDGFSKKIVFRFRFPVSGIRFPFPVSGFWFGLPGFRLPVFDFRFPVLVPGFRFAVSGRGLGSGKV